MTSSPPSEAAEVPPGPDGLPIVGSTLKLARRPIAFAERMAEEHGDVACFRFRRQPMVQLAHPDHFQHVLKDGHGNYEKGEFMRRELELLGDGLLTSEGDLWRRQRRLIGPIFHPDRIASFADTMVEYADRMADSWAPGETRAVEEDMAQLTLEVVTDALFNVDIGTETGAISDAIGTVMEGFRKSRGRPVAIPRWVPTLQNVKYRRAVSTFDSVVEGIIEEHKRSDDPPDDVVSKLLAATDEDGEGMSDTQVRDEVLTLMLAGHDTTGLMLSYAWYLLSTHPEKRAKFHEELDAVLGGRAPTLADLGDLTYTEKVLKEALRLYPPVYFMVREPIAEDEIGGYRIPEDAIVMLQTWLLHHDERFYDDPETFRPERWTPGFEEGLHDFAYVPFSGGPRRCLGDRFAMMEARLVLATIGRRYRLDYVGETPIELDPMVTLRPASSIEAIPRER